MAASLSLDPRHSALLIMDYQNDKRYPRPLRRGRSGEAAPAALISVSVGCASFRATVEWNGTRVRA